MKLDYRIVDVFTERALEGNPLAVFPNAGEIDGTLMQRIARELNLSETTFVLPKAQPGADALADAFVRIFTPRSEMRFAGHPTLGTAFVLRTMGLVPLAAQTITLEERVGLVPVRVEQPGDARSMLWLETPPIEKVATLDRVLAARALGLPIAALLRDVPCELWSAGNPTAFVALRSMEQVDAIEIDETSRRALLHGQSGPVCLFAFVPTEQGAYSRMFAPDLGVPEDPATGSATGPLARFMIEHDLCAKHDGARFVSEQGTRMGRRSLLHVRLRGARGAQGIDVGGHVVPVAACTMEL